MADHLVVIGKGRLIATGPVRTSSSSASRKRSSSARPRSPARRPARRPGCDCRDRPAGRAARHRPDARSDRRPRVRPRRTAPRLSHKSRPSRRRSSSAPPAPRSSRPRIHPHRRTDEGAAPEARVAPTSGSGSGPSGRPGGSPAWRSWSAVGISTLFSWAIHHDFSPRASRRRPRRPRRRRRHPVRRERRDPQRRLLHPGDARHLRVGPRVPARHDPGLADGAELAHPLWFAKYLVVGLWVAVVALVAMLLRVWSGWCSCTVHHRLQQRRPGRHRSTGAVRRCCSPGSRWRSPR